jgi:metacaspase-1
MAKTTRRPQAARKSAARPATVARRGISVHVGLNAVNAQHYGGWNGMLVAAEADATAMGELAAANGIKAEVLLGANATRAKVLTAIRAAAKTVGTSDLFVLSFAGCGGQIPDYSGHEADRLSETWCLYDAQLLIDEVLIELNRFVAGSRIVVVQDTGYSGTVTRAVPLPTDERLATRMRFAPAAVVLGTYREHQKFYDMLSKDVAKSRTRSARTHAVPTRPSPRIRDVESDAPAIIAISAAQDNQVATEGDRHGLFTSRLLETWDGGRFKGNYTKLFQAVRAAMPPSQTPKLTPVSNATAFVRERPFLVDSGSAYDA